jgi:hypothetical protein
MTISTDLYHQKYVPISFVRNAYTAASRSGIRTRVRLTGSTSPVTDAEFEEQILQFCAPEDLEQASLTEYGRAQELRIGTAQARPEPKYGICPSSGPHFFQDGRSIPCCNSIVSLPDTHLLEFGNAIRAPEEVKHALHGNAFFLAIKVFGFDWLREQLLALRPGRYEAYAPRNSCRFCYDACSDGKMSADVEQILDDPALLLRLHSIAYCILGVAESLPFISHYASLMLSERDGYEDSPGEREEVDQLASPV